MRPKAPPKRARVVNLSQLSPEQRRLVLALAAMAASERPKVAAA